MKMLLTTFFGICLIWLSGFVIGAEQEKAKARRTLQLFKQEAVDNGFASFTTEGTTITFKWNETK